ncbi:MAG TPA: TetR/AcrR family transcriptional regulator [Candidatus Limnocylindrales bacterium]|nr:TetR/AcrR family transcriptional regulator [Candidatus Limnocylindrales bacterium]
MQYQKEEVRARILGSALDEFEKHGFSGAQMRRIAKGARVATGNLYRYFKSKDEIFDEIVQSGYMNISALIFESSQLNRRNRGDVKSIARHIAGGIMGVYSKYGRQLLIIADKSKGSKHEDFLETLCDMGCKRIKEEMSFDTTDTDDELISLVSSGFVEGLFMILRRIKEPERIEELINRMLVFYFDDIENRIGRNTTQV